MAPLYAIMNRDDHSREKKKHIVPVNVAIPEVALGSDEEFAIFENQLDSVLVLQRAAFLPNDGVTGDNTDNFTLYVYNRGSAGAGTTVLASLEYATGVDMTQNVASELTLTSTMADRLINPGDVLVLTKTEANAGLKLEDGVLQLEFGFRVR